MSAPERVLGLVVQNANAHRTGFGPQWEDTFVGFPACHTGYPAVRRGESEGGRSSSNR